MVTDYDTPRTRPRDEPADKVLEAIHALAGTTTQIPVIDGEVIGPPGADFSYEELTVVIVPE
jgi:hypothetical protein